MKARGRAFNSLCVQSNPKRHDSGNKCASLHPSIRVVQTRKQLGRVCLKRENWTGLEVRAELAWYECMICSTSLTQRIRVFQTHTPPWNTDERECMRLWLYSKPAHIHTALALCRCWHNGIKAGWRQRSLITAPSVAYSTFKSQSKRVTSLVRLLSTFNTSLSVRTGDVFLSSISSQLTDFLVRRNRIRLLYTLFVPTVFAHVCVSGTHRKWVYTVSPM